MALKNKTHDIDKAPIVQRAPQRQVALESNEHERPLNTASALKRAISAHPAALRPADILALQRTVGNRAVNRLLAGQTQGSPASESQGRQPIQTKLTIGAAGDRYEREADRVARQVMSMDAHPSSPSIQRQHRTEEDDLQMKPASSLSITPLVQRALELEEDELQASSIQQQANTEPATAGLSVETAINNARGGGHALPRDVRARMETAFGTDFSGVRVHTDAQADTLNRWIQSRAFTTGHHLFFKQGEYNPGSLEGQELIAHELTHVVQQGGGHVAGSQAQAKAVSTILQRKNLEQWNLNAGLTKDKNTYALVGDARIVNAYSEQAPAGPASRLEALNKAGEMNAKVGAAALRLGKDWTPPGAALNDNNQDTLDPFYYRVSVPFTAGAATNWVALYFQHAKKFTGYVTKITDSANKAAENWVEMYEPQQNKALKATEKFTNIHDTAHPSSKVIDMTTSGAEGKNLDAYTKIAGEGARWQCVRKHAANLQDDSLFYTKPSAGAKANSNYVKGITFKSLWASWKSHFDKKYDIPDNEVASAIWTAKNNTWKESPKTALRSTMTAADYDLDK